MQLAEFVVDATAPTVTEPLVFVSGHAAQVSVQAYDALAGVQSIEWDAGDGTTYPGQSSSLRLTYAPGTWTGTVDVTDRAGNRTSRPFTIVLPATTPMPTASPEQPLAPSADSAPPQVTVRAARRGQALDRRAVRVTVTCSETCNARASATVTVRGRRYRAISETRTLVAGAPASLRIALGTKARRALARARGRSPVTVLVAAQDAAGNSASRRIRFKA